MWRCPRPLTKVRAPLHRTITSSITLLVAEMVAHPRPHPQLNPNSRSAEQPTSNADPGRLGVRPEDPPLAGLCARAGTFSDLQLPAVLIERLKSHGVETTEQWGKLGRKRLRLFGLTRQHVELIDAAVAEVRK